MLRLLLSPLRRFRRSERGSLSVEFVLVVPIMLFAYGGLFTFFDAFRVVNLNTRASYTIADMLSREDQTLPTDYIDGMNDVLSVLTRSQYETVLRITVVQYFADDDEVRVVWSQVDGGSGEFIQPITQATFDLIEDEVPVMADSDVNIVVETWSGFVPMLNWTGLEPQYFESVVVTRPRFGPTLCLDSGVDDEELCYAFS
ncbi:MAG: pilus assembly protein [Pseudomonadota bacterium]